MNCHRSRGFALPTVLISSVIMLIVLVSSVASTVALRSSLTAQYYNQLAKSAGEAGIAYAEACFDAGGVSWSNTLPLKPNTDCSGAALAGLACADDYATQGCWVYLGDNLVSTFSVGSPTTDSNGNVTKITATGTTMVLRKSDNSVWRKYLQTSQLAIDNPTISDSVASAKVLIVAGGGAGAGSYGGGGGGAGGLIYKTMQLASGTYNVVVGDGGTGGTVGTNGANSSFNGFVAIGGGAGGAGNAGGNAGGSGGGGGISVNTYLGGAGTPGQGFAGGDNTHAVPTYGSGGGGGAGGVGVQATSTKSGNGGPGLSYDISGAFAYYAAGGGGGGKEDNVYGTGGSGIGGNGGITYSTAAVAGAANTGSGGGGAANGQSVGGAGGSGVVVISYPTGSMSATGGTITTSGGNTIHTFTSSGDFIVDSAGTWAYKRAITVSNSNAGTINNYQIVASPFTDASLLNNNGLIGSWHFSESVGMTVFDMSGKGNHGTIGTASSLSPSGRFGNSFYGDGVTSSNKVTIPYNSSLSPTTALTIEAWVKIAASGRKEIVGQTNSTNSDTVSYNLSQNAQKIHLTLYKSAIPHGWETNTSLTLDTWHYVVATWDGTTVKIYVDGILDMTPAALASPIDSSSYPVMIGDYGNAGAVFNGYIDEVKIYNRALTGPATNCVADTSSEVCQRYGISGNPKIRGDYADIRFTDSTGTVNYSYWQENDNKFWIKIPALVNGNTTTYMYYGNKNASSISSGEGTFQLFDDFRGALIDTSKWVELDARGVMTQSNGLALTYSTSAWESAWISKTMFSRTVGLAVSGLFKASSSVAAPNRMMLGWEKDQTASADYPQLIHGLYFADGLTVTYENGTSFGGAGSYLASSTNFFTVRLKATGADYYNNGSAVSTGTGGNFTTSPMRIGIHQYGHTGTFYCIFVRQSSATEPTTSVPAAEVLVSSYVSL